MKLRIVVLAGCVLAAGYLTGCSDSPATVAEEEPDLKALFEPTGEKVYHEWKKVYSVETREKEVVRTHVGFIDRRFTSTDTEGKQFILDRTHRERGFILPGGRAYIDEKKPGGEVQRRNLGVVSFESAVKKILDAPGGIEVEVVKEVSTSPAEA